MFRASILCSVFGLLLCPLLTISAVEAETKKAAELKWAKGVMSDFLDAAFGGRLAHAEALLDVTLKKTMAKESETRLRDWLNNSIAIQEFRDPKITSESIAPDQDEAAFKGTFQGKDRHFTFSLRVLKEKESGEWRVSYFHFVEQERTPAKKDK
jgi:hypothetical protein